MITLSLGQITAQKAKSDVIFSSSDKLNVDKLKEICNMPKNS